MGTSSALKRLAAIRDWPELAFKAGYRVDELAKSCGEKNHHALRIFFAHKFRNTIKKQLREVRIREVKRRLRKRELVKNIARDLWYRNSGNLIRDFKAICGITPRQWVVLATRR